MKRIVQVICIITGFLFLGVGILGIILPVLPATPFLLITAACFAKGSERFNQWFIKTVFYREYIEKPMKKKCMSKREKYRMLITLSVIFLTAICFCPIWHIKLLIVIVALGHLYYFGIRIKNEEA